MITIPLPAGVEPARLRPSSTLVVVRDSTTGLQALMLKRAERGDQNSGAWVFPGGLLDAADRTAHDLFETGADTVASARLGLNYGGLDYFVAAVRECFEESGLLLDEAAGLQHSPDVLDSWRRKLLTGQASMAQMGAALGLRFRTSQLHFFSHWITPLEMPKRFDSRFFLAQAPDGQSALADGTEMLEQCWIGPLEALSEGSPVRLVGPALAIMRQLSVHATVRQALDWAYALSPVQAIMPVLVKDETGQIRAVVPSVTPSIKTHP